MLVFALLAAGLGAALTLLSLFLRPAVEDGGGAEAAPEGVPEETRPPSRAELRWWGLPLAAVGLIATTLTLLDRSLETTLLLGVGAGAPAGLLAAWLIRKFDPH